MSKQDVYTLLGVFRGVSAADIKKAYRKLAMQYHTDKNRGDKIAEEKFKYVTQAYEILSDPEKRAAYHQMGHTAFEGVGGNNPHPTAVVLVVFPVDLIFLMKYSMSSWEEAAPLVVKVKAVAQPEGPIYVSIWS